jgi:hypothetical protein
MTASRNQHFGKRKVDAEDPVASKQRRYASDGVPLKFAIPVVIVCALPLLFGLMRFLGK